MKKSKLNNNLYLLIIIPLVFISCIKSKRNNNCTSGNIYW